MKHFLLVAFFIGLFSCTASAQQSIEQALKGKVNAEEPSLSAKDAIKRIGTEVYVCDSVFEYKIVNDTLKMLFIGKRKSGQTLTIILKGGNTRLEPSSWVGSKISVTGSVILYENKPAIIVTHWGQLGIRIQI